MAVQNGSAPPSYPRPRRLRPERRADRGGLGHPRVSGTAAEVSRAVGSAWAREREREWGRGHLLRRREGWLDGGIERLHCCLRLGFGRLVASGSRKVLNLVGQQRHRISSQFRRAAVDERWCNATIAAGTDLGRRAVVLGPGVRRQRARPACTAFAPRPPLLGLRPVPLEKNRKAGIMRLSCTAKRQSSILPPAPRRARRSPCWWSAGPLGSSMSRYRGSCQQPHGPCGPTEARPCPAGAPPLAVRRSPPAGESSR
jgi:hypothetical protein